MRGIILIGMLLRGGMGGGLFKEEKKTSHHARKRERGRTIFRKSRNVCIRVHGSGEQQSKRGEGGERKTIDSMGKKGTEMSQSIFFGNLKHRVVDIIR